MAAVTLGVIPARLGSERLPRKPLHPIAGRPLIEWVWRRVTGLGVLDRVVIATDSDEIREAAEGFDAAVVMTRPDHRSGTERVAEVVELPRFRDVDVVVNVQGDEPFVTAPQIADSASLVAQGWDVGTAAAPAGTWEAWQDPSVVKVVRSDEGGALYFSRSPIPHVRGRQPTPSELASDRFLRHIGVYAYAPAALRRWVSLPASPLEEAERLEQLRALAAGLRIGVAVVEASEGGVDTEEDARRAEDRLRKEQAS